MIKKHTYPKVLIVAISAVICALGFYTKFGDSIVSSALAADRVLVIGTGAVTGVYYPAGGAICRVINQDKQGHGIRCTAEATSGSLNNIEELNSRRVDLSIIQSDIQYEAVLGIGTFASEGEDKNLRAVFSLHNDAFTIMVRKDSNINTFEDLKGKNLNIGSAGSGASTVMANLIELYGWKTSDFSKIYDIGTADQVDALCNKRIDVIIDSVGHPNAAVHELTTSCDLTILPISAGHLSKLLKDNPYYVKATIPGGVYPGNPKDISTLAVKATLVTRADVDEEIIYQIVKGVFNNFEIFKNLHPVFNNLDPKSMVKEGNFAPLHEGAKKYFQENKLL